MVEDLPDMVMREMYWPFCFVLILVILLFFFCFLSSPKSLTHRNFQCHSTLLLIFIVIDSFPVNIMFIEFIFWVIKKELLDDEGNEIGYGW